MAIVLNNSERATSFSAALHNLFEDASAVSVAVSYIQVGGWELFHNSTKLLDPARVRIVCTDQLGLTHPQAVRRAIDSGVRIRNYFGNNTYHPKVYLSHTESGNPLRCLLGSANLSVSAFNTSVEAGVLFDGNADLTEVDFWYNTLFTQQSEDFTPDTLLLMEERWKAAAAARIRLGLIRRRALTPDAQQPQVGQPQEVEALEDILAAIQLPIGLLNMDYGGNNARNIAKVRELLAETPDLLDSKQTSELKLLGFMLKGKRTELGSLAARATSDEEFARIWCSWLNIATDSELATYNMRLIKARQVFAKFWKLQPEIRRFFLENARSPREHRRMLQTVELLCNASGLVAELTLDDIEVLSELLNSDKVPTYIRNVITDYFENKGTRSWDTHDRQTLPIAWAEATNTRV